MCSTALSATSDSDERDEESEGISDETARSPSSRAGGFLETWAVIRFCKCVEENAEVPRTAKNASHIRLTFDPFGRSSDVFLGVAVPLAREIPFGIGTPLLFADDGFVFLYIV